MTAQIICFPVERRQYAAPRNLLKKMFEPIAANPPPIISTMEAALREVLRITTQREEKRP